MISSVLHSHSVSNLGLNMWLQNKELFLNMEEVLQGLISKHVLPESENQKRNIAVSWIPF